jgi:hypothetical protein
VKRTTLPFPILLAAFALLATGCARQATPLELSGATFQPGDGWVREIPTSSARVAEYRLPAPDTGIEDASLVIYHFGPGAGSVEANMERWESQFVRPGGGPATGLRSSVETNGLRIHTIDIRGTYVAETAPGSGTRLNEPGYRMQAAVISTDAGPYYCKLVGPAPTVAAWANTFEAFLDSVQAAPVTGEAATSHP